MGLLKKVNAKATAETNTGFGTNPSNYGGRFVNKDGTANVEKRGLNLLSRISWYHTMLNMPRWKFFIILVVFYVFINFIFACLYYGIGIQYLNGIESTGTEWAKFGKAYFFSAQTFTTVGYGHISPEGVLTSALAATEALVGLLSFAIATGIFFGRFSKPKIFLKFSDKAIIAPYKEITALMIRTAPFKNNNLTNAEVKMTLGMGVEEDGKIVSKFYSLKLEMNNINALNLSWTLVHPINEDSPLYGFNRDDFENTEGEVFVYISAFDDLYSTTVATKTSYTFEEIVYGAKFEMMYTENADNTKTILHLDRINSFAKVDLG